MAKLEPLADRVVIKPAGKEAKTESGIYIPDTASKEKPAQGEVIAVGPGRTTDDGNTIKPQVQVGDVVMFSKYAPDEIEIDEQTYLVVEESKLLAIIK